MSQATAHPDRSYTFHSGIHLLALLALEILAETGREQVKTVGASDPSNSSLAQTPYPLELSR